MTVAALLAGCTALADTHIWVGGPSNGGDLNTTSKWDKGTCPEPGDEARFQTAETVVANDDDVTLLASLGRIYLNCWAETYRQTLVVDVSTNTAITARLHGTGRFVKRGAGALEFLGTNTTDAVSSYSSYGVYNVGGDGIVVEKGTLVLAQHAGFGYYYGCLTVEEGASVVVSSNQTTTVGALNGAGTVMQLGAVEKTFQISKTEFADKPNHWKGSFSGKLTGKMALDVRGNQDLLGNDNDFTGPVKILYGRKTSDYGWARFASFGHPKSQPSSAGVSSAEILALFGAHVGYLGADETTDRNFYFDAQWSGSLQDEYFDAGPYGGLMINGTMGLASYGSQYKMRSFVLTGTNAAPCTIAGAFNMNMTKPADGVNYNFYIRKEGSGTWNFKKNANSTFKGVFDVREGTLGFDSIAETNMVCALGLATRLSDEFTGDWDDSHKSRYALRAGAQTTGTCAVLEFNGAESCRTTTRPLLLTGDAHFRANGTAGAAIDFADVSAAAAGTAEKTLVLDGTSTVANVMRDIADGDAVVSVVKDGPGVWTLNGNQRFRGDLTVKAGTLEVSANPLYSWFRFSAFGGYGSPYGGYIPEVALYDADGNRRNLDLNFNLPAGTKWRDTWYPSATSYLSLLPGEIALSQPGVSYYLYDLYPITNLCDGTSSLAAFSRSFSNSSTNSVVMRLTSGTEVVSVDFVQSSQNYLEAGYQTPSAFRLEGSADGRAWTKLVETNDLPLRSSAYWYFSPTNQKVSVTGRSPRKLSDGEGLGFDAPAYECYSVLENVGYVSVSTGATLSVSGTLSPTISKLRIDGAAGFGSISGFTFAKNMTVNVTGIPQLNGSALHLPADFSGVSTFDAVESWTFLSDGETTTKYTFRLTKTGLDIIPRGFVLLFR